MRSRPSPHAHTFSRVQRRPSPVAAAAVAMTLGLTACGLDDLLDRLGDGDPFRGGSGAVTFDVGRADDQILVGDWDGDGLDTLALRRGSEVHLFNSLTGGMADRVLHLGTAEDEVLIGDWYGDGIDSYALKRDTRVQVFDSLDSEAPAHEFEIGRPGDRVLVGDWTGDGKDTLGLRRGDSVILYFSLVPDAPEEYDEVVRYGAPEDELLVGDWDGDGIDTMALRRGNEVLVRNSHTAGNADAIFTFGRTGEEMIVGDWDGDRLTNLATRRGTTFVTATTSSQELLSRYVSDDPPTELALVHGTAADLGPAFASNSVNAIAFRHSSLVSGVDEEGRRHQYTAFYDTSGRVMIAHRDLDRRGSWEVTRTQHTAGILNAHNAISLALDGSGVLHMAWGMHGSPMRYARSVEPWSTTMGRATGVTGENEIGVTYPEFYRQSDGNLFMLYRYGSSGDGSLIVNHYDTATQTWTQVQPDLINGRVSGASAYWQATVDPQDRLQITWNWRETTDVSSNYDVMYVRSTDATGAAWERSDGSQQPLPITQENADTIASIPQGSTLMNQTGMATDQDGRPYLVTYYRIGDVVQYVVLYQPADGADWITTDTGIRSTDVELSGAGTKALDAARPQIVVSGAGQDASITLVLRDTERDSVVSVARGRIGEGDWQVTDLTSSSVDKWEPTLDRGLWDRERRLSLFVQKVGQADAEAVEPYPAEHVYVLDVPQDLTR